MLWDGGGTLAMASEGYAGDLDAEDVWPRLKEDPAAQLVDVRTRAEWSYVGVPDLRGIGKTPILVEWQSFPSMTVNPEFIRSLDAELARAGRSQSAAAAAAAAGFTPAYNVAGGFEGPRGPDGHRGGVRGWKAAGLPWTQS
jgi:rhodanese-related sulfurtransferase